MLDLLYRKKEHSMAHIARVLGVSESTVRRYLIAYNIPLRERGQKASVEGAEIEGSLRTASEQTGIPRSTLWYRRKKLNELNKDSRRVRGADV